MTPADSRTQPGDEPQTATGRKVVAIYGTALIDDVLGIEQEAATRTGAQMTAANAPVIDDFDENASPEMRRGWEAAIRTVLAATRAGAPPAIDVERLATLLAEPEHFGLLEDEGEPYEPEWWQEKAAAIARGLALAGGAGPDREALRAARRLLVGFILNEVVTTDEKRAALHSAAATLYEAALAEPAPAEAGEPDTRPCPACGAAIAPDDTHFDLMAGPAGSYVCPVLS